MRNASAVVAKPSAVWIPSGVSDRRISPSDAFLPPTTGTSSIPSSSNHRMVSAILCLLELMPVRVGVGVDVGEGDGVRVAVSSGTARPSAEKTLSLPSTS